MRKETTKYRLSIDQARLPELNKLLGTSGRDEAVKVLEGEGIPYLKSFESKEECMAFIKTMPSWSRNFLRPMKVSEYVD